jgi:hypothetical protein
MGQVDSGRPRATKLLARGFERRWISRQLERDPVRGRHPDQRRASDREPPDRLGDLGGRSQLELVLALRQRCLVQRAQRLAVEAQRDQGCA